MRVLIIVIVSFLAVEAASAQRAVSDPFRARNSNTIRAKYRSPTKKEARLLEPRPSDLARFSALMRQKKSGLIRLMPDRGCGSNPRVIVATEYCRVFSMPGGGSAFSFRKNKHRLWRLADLVYRDGFLIAEGVRSLGLMT